jgi:hypothetical protein
MEQELGVDPPPREWSDESSGADDAGEGQVAENNAAAAVNKRTCTPAGRPIMNYLARHITC